MNRNSFKSPAIGLGAQKNKSDEGQMCHVSRTRGRGALFIVGAGKGRSHAPEHTALQLDNRNTQFLGAQGSQHGKVGRSLSRT